MLSKYFSFVWISTLLTMAILISSGSAISDSGRCSRPGEACSDPQGGLCVASGSNLACQCPDSHTVVKHKHRRTCQTKLLDIACKRDNDYACAQVRDSVCAPHEARCVCPTDTVYVAHRHQCKQIYSSSPQPQYCKSCESEGGICFKEDEMNESSGPVMTEGSTFRLGCACPGNRGTARRGKVDTWLEPICSTRLRDIGDPCDDNQMVCRSKRAVCAKPRDVETDIRKCQCPDRHVPVYQQWLRYYECFKTLDIDSEHCKECQAAKPYGQCYAANNSTETGCLCPKRMSSPSLEGATVRRYCSKLHVRVSCHSNKMEVKFDPNYDSAPYNELRDRLISEKSVAFIDSYHQVLPAASAAGRQQQVCQLQPTPDGLYAATLLLDSDGACGRRTVKRTSYLLDDQVLEATLKVMWDRNFNTYPDIVVSITCRVPESGLSASDRVAGPPWQLHTGKSDDRPLLSRGILSGLSLELRVLNQWNRMIREAEESEIIKLDILLHDRTGAKGDQEYTSLLIRQCFVANKSAADADDSRVSHRGGGSGRSDKLIIGCGGEPILDSGFTAGFRGTRPDGGLHLQTGGFPAFRLGNSPTLYFRCTVRVCQHADEKLCDKASCLSDKMAKRSPDSGVRDIETESYVVVSLKRDLKWAQPQSGCQASMCLSTRQVIVIILILLVLLALVSGLVIVIYRRRLLVSAQRRLRRVSSSQDGGPTSTAVIATSAACRGVGSSGGVGGGINGSDEENDLDDLDDDAVVETPPSHRADAAKTIADYVGSPPARQNLARLAAYSTVCGSMLAASNSAAGHRFIGGDPVDGGIGAGSMTLDRGGLARNGGRQGRQQQQQQLHQQHQRLLQSAGAAQALLLDSTRPDLCTCDRQLHSSYSIASSQV